MKSKHFFTIIVCLFVFIATICLLFAVYRDDRKCEVTSSSEQTTKTSMTELLDESSVPNEANVSTKNSAKEVDEYLKEKLDSVCDKYNAVGVQMCAFDANNTYCYSFGMANKSNQTLVNDDTKYRVASLSKLVTDMVFLCLEEESLVSQHGDISNYLGYTVRNPYYSDVQITPEMLMTHTSSLIDSSSFLKSRQSGSSVPIEQLLTSSESYSHAVPGENYEYSNFGVAVIGAICEKVTGECFQDLAERYIFDPLNIDAAYVASDIYDKENIGVLYGYGGLSIETQLQESFSKEIGQTHHLVQGNLTISAKDYSKILKLLLNNGISDDGHRILTTNSVSAIQAGHFSTDKETIGYGLRTGYNNQFDVLQSVHTGSNFGMFSAFLLFSEIKSGIVVLTSGADGSINNEFDIYQICYDMATQFYEEYFMSKVLQSNR